MSTPLRQELIRIASAHPETRATLVPLLRRTAKSSVNVGDVMYSSWGYNQTNVDFYQVVGTTATMVKIRKIPKKVVGGKNQPSEKVMPVQGHFEGPVLRKKLKEYNGQPYVGISSYASAYLWDGKPKSQTGGGFGH